MTEQNSPTSFDDLLQTVIDSLDATRAQAEQHLANGDSDLPECDSKVIMDSLPKFTLTDDDIAELNRSIARAKIERGRTRTTSVVPEKRQDPGFAKPTLKRFPQLREDQGSRSRTLPPISGSFQTAISTSGSSETPGFDYEPRAEPRAVVDPNNPWAPEHVVHAHGRSISASGLTRSDATAAPKSTGAHAGAAHAAARSSTRFVGWGDARAGLQFGSHTGSGDASTRHRSYPVVGDSRGANIANPVILSSEDSNYSKIVQTVENDTAIKISRSSVPHDTQAQNVRRSRSASPGPAGGDSISKFPFATLEILQDGSELWLTDPSTTLTSDLEGRFYTEITRTAQKLKY